MNIYTQNSFENKLALGQAAEARLMRYFERAGLKPTPSTIEQQHLGDFSIKNGSFFIEVKDDEEFDKRGNLYFELGEIYTKSKKLEAVGVLKHAQYDTPILMAHLLGSSGQWAFYSPRVFLKWVSQVLHTRDDVYAKFVITEDFTNRGSGKFKLGLVIEDFLTAYEYFSWDLEQEAGIDVSRLAKESELQAVVKDAWLGDDCLGWTEGKLLGGLKVLLTKYDVFAKNFDVEDLASYEWTVRG